MRRSPHLPPSSPVGGARASASRGPAGLGRARRPGPAATRRTSAAPATRLHQAHLGPLEISKWRLGNGLELILAPDPAATSVSYTTWYRVGSRDEDATAGETGLAHLFEHLMFTQTESAAAPGEFDRQMDRVGGNVNAATDHDYTVYEDDIPPAALGLAIALEADRMAHLTLTEEQVATEREVVAEERLSTVEDDVDGVLHERLHEQAFQRHPYRFPVIGLMKDIKAVTRDRALRFYRTYYAPNNAVIVVAGRFAEAEVLAMVAAAYGPLPASSLPSLPIAPEDAPAAVVRAEVVRPVPADRLVTGLPAPGLGHPDRPAHDVAAALLAGGPSSRLHRRLVVEEQLASSVFAGEPTTRDPGLHAVWVQMIDGHRADQAEAVLDTELDRLAHQPVARAELERVRTRLEAALWSGLTSSAGRTGQLGSFEICAGDYRVLLGRAAAYGAVDAAAVTRVARRYLASGRKSVVVARPLRRG